MRNEAKTTSISRLMFKAARMPSVQTVESNEPFRASCACQSIKTFEFHFPFASPPADAEYNDSLSLKRDDSLSSLTSDCLRLITRASGAVFTSHDFNLRLPSLVTEQSSNRCSDRSHDDVQVSFKGMRLIRFRLDRMWHLIPIQMDSSHLDLLDFQHESVAGNTCQHASVIDSHD